MSSRIFIVTLIACLVALTALPAAAYNDTWRIKNELDPNEDEHPWGGDHFDGGSTDPQIFFAPGVAEDWYPNVFMGLTLNYYWFEIKSRIIDLFGDPVQHPGTTGRPTTPPTGTTGSSGEAGNN